MLEEYESSTEETYAKRMDEIKILPLTIGVTLGLDQR